MRTRTLIPFVAVLLAALTLIPSLHAQSPLVTIETVTVGDAGNAADTTGYGAVGYEFNIGKYEVTLAQYVTFLNAVAATDAYGLYSTNMALDLRVAGISRFGVSGSYTYSLIGPSGVTPPGASSPGDRPATFVSWFGAARFANWLQNGASNGASTETGAYTLNGAMEGIIPRNPGAAWWIPSKDEWYKAAYYKGGGTNAGYWLYPMQSDAMPDNAIGDTQNTANFRSGDFSVTQLATESSTQNYLTDVGAFTSSGSAYGTFDQGGNVSEWIDAILITTSGPLVFTNRVRVGGDWADGDYRLESTDGLGIPQPPNIADNSSGFRLATVPEPSTYALLAMTAAGALWWARRKR
jgi:sulfatase modifying factor 1